MRRSRGPPTTPGLTCGAPSRNPVTFNVTSIPGDKSPNPHPFISAIGKELVFPDGHLGLEIVDQRPARRERLSAVRTGGGHDDRQVTDGEIAHPVHGGNG